VSCASASGQDPHPIDEVQQEWLSGLVVELDFPSPAPVVFNVNFVLKNIREPGEPMDGQREEAGRFHQARQLPRVLSSQAAAVDGELASQARQAAALNHSDTHALSPPSWPWPG